MTACRIEHSPVASVRRIPRTPHRHLARTSVKTGSPAVSRKDALQPIQLLLHYWLSRSFKVDDFCVDWKPICSFQLVISSKYNKFSYRLENKVIESESKSESKYNCIAHLQMSIMRKTIELKYCQYLLNENLYISFPHKSSYMMLRLKIWLFIWLRSAFPKKST